MDLIAKLLLIPVARRPVRLDGSTEFRDMLFAELNFRKFEHLKLMTPEVLDRLVVHAFQKAAELDPDKIARAKRFLQAIEETSRQTILASRSDPTADPSVCRILTNSGVIS